jgi:hypothetical protein
MGDLRGAQQTYMISGIPWPVSGAIAALVAGHGHRAHALNCTMSIFVTKYFKR